MRKFPNYLNVEVSEGVVAKVSPVRLGSDAGLEASELLAQFIESGDLFGLSKNLRIVVPVLKQSLSENHDPEEVASIINSMGVVVQAGSPLFNCCLALLGIDPAALDSRLDSGADANE